MMMTSPEPLASADDEAAAGAPHDPTLDALVPRRSSWRNWALVIVAVAVLAVAWWSPTLLRPDMSTIPGAGGGTSYLTPSSGILNYVPVTVDAWPHADVVSVGDVPGLRLVGAWLVTDPVVDQLRTPEREAGESDLDYVRRAYPGLVLDDSTALPQRFDEGSRTDLVTLWEVVSCEQFVATATAADASGAFGPMVDVTLRTAIGTTIERPFDTLMVVDEDLLGCTVAPG